MEKIIVSRNKYSEYNANLSHEFGVVSVFIFDKYEDSDFIKESVRESIDYGCKYILIWSSDAKIIEDVVDAKLEDFENNEVTTTSHIDETEEDLANFIMNAIFVEEEFLLCLIFNYNEPKKTTSLKRALTAAQRDNKS